jgi:hypothetical protein
MNAENAGQWIECAFLGHDNSVARFPPVAREEARHHAVSASPVPHEDAVGLEDPRELSDHSRVVGRVIEKSKGREQVHHSVESTGPSSWKTPYVGAPVVERCAGAPLSRNRKELARIVDPVDAKPRFSQKMRMTTLTAWRIENASANRKTQDINYPRGLGSIAPGGEHRRVLPEVMRIEIAFPPLAATTQKNTGSR